ncbi:MAG: hypothetical protein AABY22_25830 [Nanoarchaeota archaeon]
MPFQKGNKINYKNGKPKCIDCGEEPVSYTAKRCFPCYNKTRFGEKNSNYKDGKPKCLNCYKRLNYYGNKRCKECNIKIRFREKSKCLDCNKQLSNYKAKRCRNCAIGELSRNWKGGITKLRVAIYNSRKHKILLEQSKQRDNYQCLMPNCDSESNYLESNHIKLFSKILEEKNIQLLKDAYNCSKFWDIKNLITLCKPCHKYIRGREEEFKNLFRLILEKLYYAK